MIIEENLSESVLVRFPQYTRNVGFYRFTPYQVLVDLMLEESIKPNSTVLDAGCGKNPALPTNVNGVAVDISLESVRMLKRQKRGLECFCASVEALPFKRASFDIVVSRDVLEHCNSALSVREIGRVLKQGGEFIASTSNGFSPIMLLDKLLGRFADCIAGNVGSQYFPRTQHLNPYSLKSELVRAGFATKRLLMVTTPPLLTAQTWRVFVKRVPWKLVPWLFVSVLSARFRIFRETLVVNAMKCRQ